MPQPPNNSNQPFLPRYEVLGLVGEGAAARIYRAIDKQDGSVRAIKALKSENNAEPSVVKRFEDEYRILRGLHHPSLPEVYDYGFSDDGSRYMVMEFVEGEPLDRFTSSHREDLWLLMYELCEVLSFIHSHNLLHFDLKPANVLVRRTAAYGAERPMAVLIDFGLSYRRDEGGGVSLVGTPEYMAPEIIRGEERLTRAVDYYSLGVTLYELLTGEPPFRGEIRDVFSGHLQREIRFQEEKTEYAELYPHVLGLVAKDVNARLEAFEDFRRAVAGRLGGGVGELERAYGLSFLSSIGTIGKKEEWRVAEQWLNDIDAYLASRSRMEGASTVESAARVTAAVDAGPIASDASFVRELERELLASAPSERVPEVPVVGTTVERPYRSITVKGPAGSGKTYVVERLVDRCRLRGRTVRYLGVGTASGFPFDDTTDFAPPGETKGKSAAGAKGADPRSFLLDRYMHQWDRLVSVGATDGVVLVVDGLERLEEEQKGFLEYVAKRIGISESGGEDPGVYIVVSGNHPRLERQVVALYQNQIESKALTIPPLRKADLEDLVARFHGRMISGDDRRNLQEFIARFDASAGAVTTVLNNALLKGALSYGDGMWRFRPPPDTVSAEEADLLTAYYRDFLSELAPRDRAILEWVCCHDGPISIERLEVVSGIALGEIDESIAVLAPFRILDESTAGGVRAVSLASQNTQKALYNNIGVDRRQEVHESYARAYEREAESVSSRDVERGLSIGQQLAYHYQKLGEHRQMILTQLRVMQLLKGERRFYDLRRVAERSLESLALLKGRQWHRRQWHIRRYFLKQYIEACWSLSDYSAIRRAVGVYFSRNRRKVPVSFVFKYCLALVFAGEYDAALAVVNRVRHRNQNRNSEPFVVLRLIEAIIRDYKDEYRKSLKILREVESKKNVLNEYGRCRLYMTLVMVHDKLGNEELVRRYNPLLEEIAKRNGFVHEYLMSIAASFWQMFARSMLTQCKSLARRAMSVASRNKAYYRLSEWYFMTSGVYYEEGLYRHSIRYIDKALRLTISMGLVGKVPALLTRLAMNYQNMGLYGNAIKHMERARRATKPGMDPEIGAVVVLFSLDIGLSVNSRNIASFRKQAEQFMRAFGGRRRMGYFWYLDGVFSYKTLDLYSALKSFQKARHLFQKSGIADDAARSSIKEAIVLLELERFDEAEQVLLDLGRSVRILESKNIAAEYHALRLAYHYFVRSSHSTIRRYLIRCEEAALDATEVPVLLWIERIVFRARARIGDVQEAKRAFNNHLRKIKKTLSNMPDREYASNFLNDRDEHLLIREYKLVKN
jgi:serine/threonine protein kinase/tetratricopeptide (TPR) repeat protein